MADTASVRCPSCGDQTPNAELLPDGGIYCRREKRVTGGTYKEVPPERGWYLLSAEPSKEQYWDGREKTGKPREAEEGTKPFPGMQRVMLADDAYEEVPPPRGWYILPDDPSHQQLWNGREWVGKPFRLTGGSQPFPGVQRVKPGVGAPNGPRLNEDGTKTCPECAERVQGAALVCRFCGYRFDGKPVPVAPGEASTSGAAVAAFICSLVGLWIAGIPLGIHAQHQIEKSEGRMTGRGFATAGIILGVLGIIGTIILIIVLVSAAKHNGCTYTYNATGGCVPE